MYSSILIFLYIYICGAVVHLMLDTFLRVSLKKIFFGEKRLGSCNRRWDTYIVSGVGVDYMILLFVA